MTILNDNSKKCFLKIFALHPSPLDTCMFWKKHSREKWQKVDPHYFSILEGVYFLHFFLKITPSASNLLKTEILPLKLQKGLKSIFFKKLPFWNEESRPPLKLKNIGGLLPFFSWMLRLKDTGVKGAWISSKNFQKTLFGIVI